MNHYISVSTDAKSNECAKIDIVEALRFLLRPENASPEKGGWLFHPAYNENQANYKRWESMMDKFSTIMIDCDNKEQDPHILDRWHERMSGYDYIVYETYSSTPDHPKFRAIIPMDDELQWNKNAKISILQTFHEFADEKATWFFAPTKNKLNTVKSNKSGRKFPSKVLKEKIEALNLIEQINQSQRAIEQSKYEERKSLGMIKEHIRKDYHELPLVQEYFAAVKGERNSTAHKAACSMFSRGYEEFEIKSMLKEGPIERRELNQGFQSASRLRKL